MVSGIAANGRLGEPLAHQPARAWASQDIAIPSVIDISEARGRFDELRPDIAHLLDHLTSDLNYRLQQTLNDTKIKVVADENSRFRSRQGELAALMRENTAEALEREIDKLRDELKQGLIFGQAERDAYIKRLLAEKEAELSRRTEHLKELMDLLKRERTRTLEHLVPRRFSLRGQALALPVAIEIRLPVRSS